MHKRFRDTHLYSMVVNRVLRMRGYLVSISKGRPEKSSFKSACTYSSTNVCGELQLQHDTAHTHTHTHTHIPPVL